MRHTYSTHLNIQNMPDNKTFEASLRPLLLSMLLVGFSSHATAVGTYTMTDLSTTGIFATKISPSGQVLAVSTTPVSINTNATYLPQIYNSNNGSLSNISTVSGGGIFIDAVDINTSGQVVGHISAPYTGITNNPIFIRNADSAAINLGMVDKAYSTTPLAINDAGQVAGYSTAPLTGCTNAFVSTLGGGLQSLGSLETAGFSKALDINTSGQAVGNASIDAGTQGCRSAATRSHAFVSTATGLKDLHASTMYNLLGIGSIANAINDNGLAVGSFAVASGPATDILPNLITHAVRWDTATGTYTDFGTGTTVSSAFRAINSSGQMVGFSATDGVIDNATGGLTKLTTLTVGMPTGWTITNASSISDAGLILATAKDAIGLLHDVLLTPQSISTVNLPIAPTNLISTTASSTQINPTWIDNATNETAQYLERCQGTNCTNFTPLATLAANITNYADTTLTPATPYSYRIRAHSATGDSPYSNIATAATLSLISGGIPTAPSGLMSSMQSKNQIILNWVDNANNEKNYFIERCKGLNCTNFAKIATLGANVTTYSNIRLSANTNYSYRILASNISGKSICSAILNVKTLP